MVAGPTVPPPPALLSVAIGWPRCLEAASAIARIEMSVEPPAGQGTISVIGLVGYSCAKATLQGAMSANAAINAIKRGVQNIGDFSLCGSLRFGRRRCSSDDRGPALGRQRIATPRQKTSLRH